MTSRKKYKWLNRRIAKQGPFLTLVLSDEELQSAMKGMTKEYIQFPESGALCTTLVHDKLNDLCAIISVSKHAQETADAIEMAGLLIHEAVHVWQCYAESIGERTPGNEQEAYAIQAISQELLSEYARRIFVSY